MTPRSFDVFGNIALVKFDRDVSAEQKKNFAMRILHENKSVRTVLEKTGKFKGRLRKQKTNWIAGEKTKEVLYKENGCVFRFNIDNVYFSTRLSGERKELAGLVKKRDEVFVMFAGAAPFPIVIAKNSKASKVYSNEINKEANKYGRQNAELNKVKNKIVFLDGDIKRIAQKLAKQKKKFHVIVMPRPQLKDSFLKEAFMLSKKGTRIYYYDFCTEEEKQEVIEKIVAAATRSKKKIKISRIKNAGEIAPYKYRIRVDFTVVN